MKVLSLKQPYADLIKNKIKMIETRSWSTKYRGELYIHTSKTKINYKELRNKAVLNFINVNKCEYGAIILKCKLVDCILMTEEFINEIKQNKNEYLCGYYEIGRYAWLLSDIEIIKPIYVNGKLGIWNYNG
ncbi:MAG: ASCH domain-containing protein [Bacilli bacterium]|nr:ASCH domain-containing protein [Bacilli bacterium]